MNQGYCRQCGKNVKAEKSYDMTSISLNIFLCIFTVGIWSIIFFGLLLAGGFTSYRCNSCGGNISPALQDVAKITPPNGACATCNDRVELVKSNKLNSALKLLTMPKWYWQLLLTIATAGAWLGLLVFLKLLITPPKWYWQLLLTIATAGAWLGALIIFSLFGTRYVCKHCNGKVDGIRDIP